MTMPKKPFAFALSTLAALLPLASYAQTTIPLGVTVAPSNTNPQTLADVIGVVIYYLNAALGLMMAFAVVMFVWYVIQYFIKADADRKAAGTYVLFSVIGFFVILSIWGLVNILGGTFGLSNQSNSYQTWQSFGGLFPR
ncbi:MAG: hypothetical protein KGI69_01925 [Patescibacteria group bacterium]|nr:hypothetical protein [Patescibacteria group bacterium]